MFLTADCLLTLFSHLHGGRGAHVWNLRLGTVLRLSYVRKSSTLPRHAHCNGYWNLLQWINVTAIIYIPTEFLIRLSILLQYLRIFVPNRQSNRFMYYASHALIWCNLIFYLSKFIGLLAICNPRKKLWEPVSNLIPVLYSFISYRIASTPVLLPGLPLDHLQLILPSI